MFCDSQRQPTAIEEDGRRADANARFRGDYVHTIPATPGKKKGKQKQSRIQPGAGYRPDRAAQNSGKPKRKKK